jgi:cyclopropane-fatty-acyl-phospholipid synthase
MDWEDLMSAQVKLFRRTASARAHRRDNRRQDLLERIYTRMFSAADIQTHDTRDWDMLVHDQRLYRRLALQGSLGLGESYVEAWWDSPQLDQFFTHLMAAELDRRAVNIPRTFAVIAALVHNLQSLGRAGQVGTVHYDIGNEFYREMLGPSMVYTCAYWRAAKNLDEAQEHKLELVCRKMHLQTGMTVLDVGCGWGSFARYAAEKYDVKVVGVTISAEQAAYAREYCADLPVEIRLQDYRKVDQKFDRIVSLGMIEHVGHKNYRTYMECVRRNLTDDGLFVLQTVGRIERGTGIDPWVTKYIFPNSEVPTLDRINSAINGSLRIEDLQNFGVDYDRTLMAWYGNFERAWPRFENTMSPNFYRLWKYYLLMFAGIFRARRLELWQLVLAPKQFNRGYRRPLA